MASTIKTLTLEVGLVRVNVSLRAASEKKDITLERATPDGRRIKRIDIPEPEEGAAKIELALLRNEKGELQAQQFEGAPIKGVWEDGEFHEIPASEIEVIDELTKLDTFTVQEFIPIEDIPWERAQASYFLVPPKGVGVKTLVALRKAMKRRNAAGVAKLMPRSRQKLAVIYPKHGGLMVTCLSYADAYEQVLEGAAKFSGVEVDEKIVSLTEKLVTSMMEPASVLNEYRDDKIDLRADLIERAKLGEEPIEAPEPQPEVRVPDSLEEALEESFRRADSRETPVGVATSSERAVEA